MPNPASDPIPAEAVLVQLDKILKSPLFENAHRLSRFLSFTVETVLAGRGAEIKEYLIGVEVYERDSQYDPRTDPSVRVQARQLRAKLSEYYRTTGHADPVLIELPKGTYAPAFRLHSAESTNQNGAGAGADHSLAENELSAKLPSRSLESDARKAHPAGFPHSRLAWTAAAVVVLVAVAVGANSYRRIPKVKAPPAAAAPDSNTIHLRPSVAVLGFEDLSGADRRNHLADALCEMVATEVGASGEIRLVPEVDVARARAAVLPAGALALSRDTLGEFRSQLAVDYVVFGSYTLVAGKSGSQLRVDIRLQNAATGEILAARSEAGAESALFRLAERTGTDVRRALGQKVSSKEEAEAAALLPSSAQAARYYVAGTRELHQQNGVVARDLLQQVVQVEPRFALGHYQLSGAWGFLGYGVRGRAEAKKALDLSGQLDATTRLLIEANYHDSNHDWEKAKSIRRALFSAYPDAIDNGVELAWDLIHSGNEPEALSVLDQLRRLPPALADDPGIDQAEAFARASMSDNERARAACVRGEEKAHARGLRVMEARLRSLEGGILGDMGRGAESRTVSLEAAQMCEREGDRDCVMEIERRLGNSEVITDNPNPEEALKHYNRALAVAREIGDSDEINFDLIGMATADWTAGKLDTARGTFEELLVTTRKADPGVLANVEVNYGGMLTLEGDVAPAIKMLREAAAIDRQRSAKGALADALQNLAEAERRSGDLKTAERDYRESINLYQEVAPQGKPDAEVGLSDVLWDQGDLAATRATLSTAESDAQSVAKKWPGTVDSKATIAECHVRLARVAFADGDFASAEAGAREGVSALGDKHPEEAVEAGILLAEDLDARGKQEHALTALTTTQRLLTKMPYTYYRLEELIGRAVSCSGKREGSRRGGSLQPARYSVKPREPARDLLSVIALAGGLGLVGIELRAQLALGEIELESGDRTAGRGQLHRVHRDAQSRGFRLLASRATEKLQTSQLALWQAR